MQRDREKAAHARVTNVLLASEMKVLNTKPDILSRKVAKQLGTGIITLLKGRYNGWNLRFVSGVHCIRVTEQLLAF